MIPWKLKLWVLDGHGAVQSSGNQPILWQWKPNHITTNFLVVLMTFLCNLLLKDDDPHLRRQHQSLFAVWHEMVHCRKLKFWQFRLGNGRHVEDLHVFQIWVRTQIWSFVWINRTCCCLHQQHLFFGLSFAFTWCSCQHLWAKTVDHQFWWCSLFFHLNPKIAIHFLYSFEPSIFLIRVRCM